MNKTLIVMNKTMFHGNIRAHKIVLDIPYQMRLERHTGNQIKCHCAHVQISVISAP